jgi:hypothetical protein
MHNGKTIPIETIPGIGKTEGIKESCGNKKCWLGMGKRSPHTLLVGMCANTITMENNMEAS